VRSVIKATSARLPVSHSVTGDQKSQCARLRRYLST